MRSVAHGSHFSTCHVWFEQFLSIDDLNRLKAECKGIDYVVIHGNRASIEGKGFKSSRQYSLVSDLTSSNEELLNLMTKTIRNEINRSERENVEVLFHSSQDLKSSLGIIDGFARMYHEMYAQKGMESVQLPTKELAGYIDANQLIVSIAKIDGKPVVYHSHVYGDGCSRLLHSCSEFRVADNATRNAIGRANKYLHWTDIQRLKDMGTEKYDWGGVSSFDNPNGIDRFKMAFGPEPVEYCNISFSVSMKHRLYERIKSLWRCHG
ncbi:MAG: hypothetical protein IJ863_07590 [Spirochaetales bacterium]|nr:hypothetical protein [Spirochaetales bacterium]